MTGPRLMKHFCSNKCSCIYTSNTIIKVLPHLTIVDTTIALPSVELKIHSLDHTFAQSSHSAVLCK